jgi:hypothetical protein
MLCELLGRYQCFGRKYCLHLQGWSWRQYVPISLYGITGHNDINVIMNLQVPWKATISALSQWLWGLQEGLCSMELFVSRLRYRVYSAEVSSRWLYFCCETGYYN